MTKKEQKRLAQAICAFTVKKLTVLIQQDKIPESWDGIEIREWLADEIRWHKLDGSRKREYQNTVAVNGL